MIGKTLKVDGEVGLVSVPPGEEGYIVRTVKWPLGNVEIIVKPLLRLPEAARLEIEKKERAGLALKKVA